MAKIHCIFCKSNKNDACLKLERFMELTARSKTIKSKKIFEHALMNDLAFYCTKFKEQGKTDKKTKYEIINEK